MKGLLSKGLMNSSNDKKVIARIMGGLGNQLFCYAAARRLSLTNHAELILDDVTGFVRDHQYRRQYMLDNFQIPSRKATPAERLEPFERYRRGIAKILSRKKAFQRKSYIEQEGSGFDERLLGLKVMGTIYLDGLWQSPAYFTDVEEIIRKDLQVIPPIDRVNQCMARDIEMKNVVALHVRWFDTPDSNGTHNVSTEYYKRAISLMESKMDSPLYYLFSDDPDAAFEKLFLSEKRVISVTHNRGDENAFADLWLMQKCKHFIIPRSTFSWWGAWLCMHSNKRVIMPSFTPKGAPEWDSIGMIFDRCTQIA